MEDPVRETVSTVTRPHTHTHTHTRPHHSLVDAVAAVCPHYRESVGLGVFLYLIANVAILFSRVNWKEGEGVTTSTTHTCAGGGHNTHMCGRGLLLAQHTHVGEGVTTHTCVGGGHNTHMCGRGSQHTHVREGVTTHTCAGGGHNTHMCGRESQHTHAYCIQDGI